MSLDIPTLHLLAAIVIITTSSLFLSEVWARAGAAVDRLWSLAFVSAMTTAFAYFAASLDAALWWANAVGNGASALTVWAMWSGIRSLNGRASLIAVSGGVAALVAAALLIGGPDGGPWAGGAVTLAATAMGAIAGGAAAVRGNLRVFRSGTTLAVILFLAGGYYVLRLIVFVAAGPDSAVFEQYLGTAVSTIATTVLVTSTAFVAMALRAQHARERASVTHNFDPLTGTRTATCFGPQARVRLRTAAEAGQPVALVEIVPEELRSIAIALGQEAADDALLTCAETARACLPVGGIIGREGDTFVVLLPGYSPARALTWATTMRKDLIDAPLTLAGRTLRVTASIGVADSAGGYDLDAMQAKAAAAAREALAQGGNRALASDELTQPPR